MEREIALTQNHLQHGNSDCNQQINNHLTTFLVRRLNGEICFAAPNLI